MSHHGQSNKASSPLWAATLCWTSITPEQRSEMVSVAAQMGASHKLDLTSDVTHLIVGNIDSAKYKYVAKERQDIKVLKPSWLDAVRESWMQGEETNITALEEEHRLPTFSNLQICVTGFDDVTERQGLQDAVNDNGATYHGDLTKSVTHLVAAAPKGKKYEYARIWNIKVVSIDWVRDSLERGMVLEESLYHPTVPAEERGVGAVTRRKPPPQQLGKRQRNETESLEGVNAGRRKLRRSASSKFGGQSGDLWAEIGRESHSTTPRIEPKRQDSPIKHDQVLQSLHNETNVQSHDEDVPAVCEGQDEAGVERQSKGLLDPGGTMSAMYFVLGFEGVQKARLLRILSQNGADVLESIETRDYAEPLTFVLPYNIQESVFADDGISDECFITGDLFVTDLWLEKCLYDKTYVDPGSQPLYTPFHAHQIPELESLTICPTSFGGADLRHVALATKATGATYDETLRRLTSVLVCNSGASINSEKLKYAIENEIPVVSEQWLWDSIKACKRLEYDNYTLSGSRFSQRTNSTQPEFFHPVNNPRARPAPSRAISGRSDKPANSRSQRIGQLFFSREARAERIAPQRTDSSKASAARTSGARPRHLQDMSPNLSPRKQSQTSQQDKPSSAHRQRESSKTQDIDAPEDEDLLAPGESNEPDDSMLTLDETLPTAIANAPLPPPAPPQQHPTAAPLDSAIAALLAHKRRTTTSRPSSASSEPQKHSDIPRKHRPLGRAPSNGSTTSFSRQNSTTEQRAFVAPARRPLGPFEDDDDDDAETEVLYQPSQVLGYEDPESVAHRARVFGHDGAADHDGGGAGGGAGMGGSGMAGMGMKRVESIGRVTDASRDPVEEKQRRRAMRRKVQDA